jgi:hypothetical protein
MNKKYWFVIEYRIPCSFCGSAYCVHRCPSEDTNGVDIVYSSREELDERTKFWKDDIRKIFLLETGGTKIRIAGANKVAAFLKNGFSVLNSRRSSSKETRRYRKLSRRLKKQKELSLIRAQPPEPEKDFGTLLREGLEARDRERNSFVELYEASLKEC